MLKKIKNKLKKYRYARYQKIVFTKNDINLRNNAIKYICNLEQKVNIVKEDCKSCEFYEKNLNKENFIKFYKKFNSNLQLKEKYNINTFQKATSKNACFKSYIQFSNFLEKNKEVNNIQKLNTILKINDLLILMFEEDKHINFIKNFKRNIKYEKKLINLFL